MSRLIPGLIGVTSLILIVLFGACVTGLVLKEPDICFLLAGGKWIAEHGAIPQSDPFAYNISRAYIVEQWLTELIFFWLWKYAGSLGLLLFDALILTLTFVTMPYRLMRLNLVSAGRALTITTVIAAGAFVHISVRPEIFSVLFVAFYLEILKRLDLRTQAESADAKQIHWPTVASLALIMALWTNLHILFVGGLMLLVMHCLTTFWCIFKNKAEPQPKLKFTSPAALIASVLATLANPYGFGLWLHLPGLMTWPKTNEVKPISLDSLHDPCAYSFFLLIILTLIDLRKVNFKALFQNPGPLFFRALIPAGIFVGARAIRAIPMANIMLAASLNASGKNSHDTEFKSSQNESSENSLNAALARFFDPPFWQALCLGCGMLGAGLMTRIIPPEFPQGSAAFNPPFAAVDYIIAHPLNDLDKSRGNLLNDPHFGNVMMWRMNIDNDFPKLFIDSRYHLFKDEILDDYWTMVLCREGWQNKMEQYKISRVFVPTKLEIVDRLKNDSQSRWRLIYQDDTASILVKTSP